jgi:hypothetical protein
LINWVIVVREHDRWWLFWSWFRNVRSFIMFWKDSGNICPRTNGEHTSKKPAKARLVRLKNDWVMQTSQAQKKF